MNESNTKLYSWRGDFFRKSVNVRSNPLPTYCPHDIQRNDAAEIPKIKIKINGNVSSLVRSTKCPIDRMTQDMELRYSTFYVDRKKTTRTADHEEDGGLPTLHIPLFKITHSHYKYIIGRCSMRDLTKHSLQRRMWNALLSLDNCNLL